MNRPGILIFIITLICSSFITLSGCQAYYDHSDVPKENGFTEAEGTTQMKESGENKESIISEAPTKVMFVKLERYGSKLNVRERPSTRDNIIGELGHGDRVEVFSLQSEWAKINFKNGNGYVNTEFLAEKKPLELVAPHVSISPGEVYLNIYKGNRTLELRNKDNELFGEYSTGLGFDPVGHKEKEGDGKTPEGSYYVCVRNSNSKFHLSLGVSYPGIDDAKKGLADGLITQSEYNSIVNSINSKGVPLWNTALGGQIMIHGLGGSRDWTAGCIAVDNDVIDVLWEYCTIGTKINIYP